MSEMQEKQIKLDWTIGGNMGWSVAIFLWLGIAAFAKYLIWG